MTKSFLKKYNRTDVWLKNLLHDAGYDIVSNPGSLISENPKVTINSSNWAWSRDMAQILVRKVFLQFETSCL